MENLMFVKQTEGGQGLGWEASWGWKHKLYQWMELIATYKLSKAYTNKRNWNVVTI